MVNRTEGLADNALPQKIERQKSGELGGRDVASSSTKKTPAHSKVDTVKQEALRKAGQQSLLPPITAKQKAAPEKSAGLKSELATKNVGLTEKQQKKFVVVQKGQSAILQHHSSLSFTDKIAYKLGLHNGQHSAAFFGSNPEAEKLASTVLDLRTAIRSKDESAIRNILQNAPIDKHGKLFEMLSPSKEDLRILHSATHRPAKTTVFVGENTSIPNQQTLASALKNNDLTKARTLFNSISEENRAALMKTLSKEEFASLHKALHTSVAFTKEAVVTLEGALRALIKNGDKAALLDQIEALEKSNLAPFISSLSEKEREQLRTLVAPASSYLPSDFVTNHKSQENLEAVRILLAKKVTSKAEVSRELHVIFKNIPTLNALVQQHLNRGLKESDRESFRKACNAVPADTIPRDLEKLLQRMDTTLLKEREFIESILLNIRQQTI